MGFLPLFLGFYLAIREDYFISILCFLISICGFQQVYNNIKIQELLNSQAKELTRINKTIIMKEKREYYER